MENASKALIIAGAILLAILIITLGIMIYRQGAGVLDSNAMDEVAVSSFNQKFQQYEGENIRGANVNALINTVIQNNLTNKGDKSKQIKLVSGTNCDWNGAAYPTTAPTDAQTTKSGSALTGKSYKVTCHADEKSGYIDQITIENAQ